MPEVRDITIRRACRPARRDHCCGNSHGTIRADRMRAGQRYDFRLNEPLDLLTQTDIQQSYGNYYRRCAESTLLAETRMYNSVCMLLSTIQEMIDPCHCTVY